MFSPIRRLDSWKRPLYSLHPPTFGSSIAYSRLRMLMSINVLRLLDYGCFEVGGKGFGDLNLQRFS